MERPDKESLRRLLETALANLEREPNAANSFESFEIGDSRARAVLIMIDGRTSDDQIDAPRTAEASGQTLTQSGNERSHHAGHDRFPLSDPRVVAPKPCFMEPGRTCVHSGACEMRGF